MSISISLQEKNHDNPKKIHRSIRLISSLPQLCPYYPAPAVLLKYTAGPLPGTALCSGAGPGDPFSGMFFVFSWWGPCTRPACGSIPPHTAREHVSAETGYPVPANDRTNHFHPLSRLAGQTLFPRSPLRRTENLSKLFIPRNELGDSSLETPTR